MTPKQIGLVRESFAKVAPISDQAGALFYDRLFQIAPDVRPLFKGEIGEQGRKLMATIGVAVASLDKLPQLVPVLQDLGRRHAGNGVRDEHYDVVAAALLWTLENGLGDAFTSEVKDAWVSAYSIVADTMKRAAHHAAA